MRKFLIVLIVVVLSSFLMGAGCFISNQPPEITSKPVETAIVGVEYVYDVNATDPNASDTLSYSLISVEPGNMYINPDSGVITWIPTAVGSFDVTVEVSDGDLSDTQDFTIVVSTVEITGIEVVPDEMTLSVGGSEAIKSVTATYVIKKGLEASIDLENCTYEPSPLGVVTVSNGVVKAVTAGKATITVTYAGMTDEIAVTVVLPVHNITKVPDKYYATIQDAINDASDGDTIEVSAGNYLESTLFLTKSLTIQGAGKANTVIDAGGAQYGIRIQTVPLGGSLDSVTIKDLTVENVDHSNIVIYSTTVTDVVIENVDLSGSGWAGLVTNVGTVEDLLVEGCTFEDFKRHGVRVDTSSIVGHLTVIDSDFDTAEDALIIDGIPSQAGIESCGNIDELTVSGCTFTGTVDGIRLFWYWTDRTTYSIDNVDIEGSTFEGNDASFFFYVRTDGQMIGDIQIHDCSFTDSEWGVNFDDSGMVEAYKDVVIDATNNWWGSEFGPKHNGFPENGGTAVSDNVDYSNWSLTQY
ncbi:hypothetical protein ES704_01011 [subsurface metagenome]|jgi:hypothetical protein